MLALHFEKREWVTVNTFIQVWNPSLEVALARCQSSGSPLVSCAFGLRSLPQERSKVKDGSARRALEFRCNPRLDSSHYLASRILGRCCIGTA